MPTKPIPDRDPYGEWVPGALLQQSGHWLLTLDAGAGPVLLRYAARYLGKPHLAVVPGLIALDYGDFLTGHDAWEFLFKHSNLYPRADVIGYRHDGRDEMTLVKHLDLALTPMVLAYPSEEAAAPLGEVSALIAPDDAIQVSAYLAAYLPRFESRDAWRTSLSGESSEESSPS